MGLIYTDEKTTNPREDITGNKYGHLTVIGQGNDIIVCGIKRVAWDCLCDCGNTTTVLGRSLKNGNTKSCKCCDGINRYSTKDHNTYDFSNDNYVIGKDIHGKQFYFDKEDYEKIKDYIWVVTEVGYVDTNSHKIKMHRLLMDCPDGLVVDHINSIKYDNRKSNLRIVDTTTNVRNINPYGKSGILGVHWHKRHNKWIANVTVNGKLKHLGYFTNKEDAEKIRQQAEFKYYGEII